MRNRRFPNDRDPDPEVGDALFEPKLGEFAGFGKDLFVPPAQGLGFLSEWKQAELHARKSVAQIMPQLDLKKMWKIRLQEPK